MAQENDPDEIVFEMADRLFDTYVDEVDIGKIVGVRIEWVPIELADEIIQAPRVFINDEPAEEVFLRTASYTGAAQTLDAEDLEIGGRIFNDMMAGLEDAIKYRKDLRALDEQIDSLAISNEAGYSAVLRENLESQGLDGIGDGEVISIARSLIIQDIAVLGFAAERADDYNALYEVNLPSIQRAFEQTPEVYWVMVGKDTGEIRASGARGTIPNSESHINMEYGFKEDLFTYLRPVNTTAK